MTQSLSREYRFRVSGFPKYNPIQAMQPRYALLPFPIPKTSTFSMPRRALTRIIYAHERSIHIAQAFKTILQGFGHVVGSAQPRFLVQHDVHLDPDAVAGVVGCDGFVGVDLCGERGC